jgi:4-hydroxy-3-polyprenylbenzoate decarboxylase
MSTFVVGITGASGALYGLRLLEALAAGGHRLHVVVTSTGRSILKDETGVDLGATPASARAALAARLGAGTDLTVHAEHNLYAPIASGSVPTDAMVVAPCSMKAAAAIAHGLADGLLERAADVHIKEGRPLLLVPRETPLSPIHLENLLKLSRLPGVRVIPAMPGFYTHPKTVGELVDFVVARILDGLGVGPEWHPRWRGGDPGAEPDTRG